MASRPTRLGELITRQRRPKSRFLSIISIRRMRLISPLMTRIIASKAMRIIASLRTFRIVASIGTFRIVLLDF